MTKFCCKKGCQKLVWVEPRTGIEHDYCGRSHAQECEGTRLHKPHGRCHECSLQGCSNIVYFDEKTGRVHDFCCREHAHEGISRGDWPAPAATWSRSRNNHMTHGPVCSLRGCSLPCFIDAQGRIHDYCGRSHAILAKQEPVRFQSPPLLPPPPPLQATSTSPRLTPPVIHFIPTAFRVPPAPLSSSNKRARKSCCDSCANITSSLTSSSQPPVHLTCLDCNEKEVHEWACDFCKLNNMTDDPRCIMCGTGCPSLPAQLKGSKLNLSTCGLPGCTEPAVYYGFCSKDHLDRAVERNMMPPMIEGVDRSFRGPSKKFSVHLLMNKHLKYNNIKKQFLNSWANPENGEPRVERIYWIVLNQEIHSSYLKAKESGGGKVLRRFHGTSQNINCMFGTDPSKAPCDGRDCNVCSICKTSFKLSRAASGGGRRMNLRYGEGLYFSPVSSKSHDYNTGSERVYAGGRKWRAMFLCNVVAGRSFVTKEGFLDPALCPPRGYDSVVGEVGVALNYPEVVVYDEVRAIPSFLIVYSTK